MKIKLHFYEEQTITVELTASPTIADALELAGIYILSSESPWCGGQITIELPKVE